MSTNILYQITIKAVYRLVVTLRCLSGQYRTKPDFIIAGAQKAGTSSLYKYLIQHPNILPSIKKEVHYFDLNYSKSENWYTAHFPFHISNKSQFITGEASPYYMFHPYALKRIAEFKPDIKVIVILRNPVERAISHYHHEKRRGREPLNMLDALKAEDKRLESEIMLMKKNPEYISFKHQRYSYKKRGEYLKQLKKMYSIFPKENILLLESGEFFANPEIITRKVFCFLGVNENFKLRDIKKYNAGNYFYHAVPSEVFSYLKEYFHSYNKELFQFIERRFDWSGPGEEVKRQ